MHIIYIHKIYRNRKLFTRFAHMNGLWKTVRCYIQVYKTLFMFINNIYPTYIYLHDILKYYFQDSRIK